MTASGNQADSTNNRFWLAVYTKPRAEKRLSEALTKKGIANYLPLIRIRRKWSDRYKIIEEPLFHSYLFVHINPETEVLEVLRLPNALNIVQHGGKPAVLSEEEISILRFTSTELGDSLTVRDSSELVPGDRLMMTNGPFKGKEAVIVKNQGRTSIVVTFPSLNKQLEVAVPVDMVQRVLDWI